MTEQEQRAEVIRQAYTWRKTPFVWGACIKGVGTDCGRFIAACLNDAGAQKIDVASLPQVTPQWFMHRADGTYLDLIRRFAVEYDLKPGQVPQMGDIVVAKCGRDWAHSALVVDWPKVIGAASEHCVTEWKNLFLSPQYATRELKYFNPWGTRND